MKLSKLQPLSKQCLLAVATALLPLRLIAHEFWIEPVDFTLSEHSQLVAEIRNGQEYKGMNLPFMPSGFNTFFIHSAASSRAIESRLGDLPAVSLWTADVGLHTLQYESTEQSIRYSTFERFEKFATEEGHDWAIEAHQTRQLQEAHFLEIFTRYCKSLISVGDNGVASNGQDRLLGMELELVLETNPYKREAENAITVALYYNKQPLPDTQISVFSKQQGLIQRIRTDQQGKIVFKPNEHMPTSSGPYLLSAVHLRIPDKALEKRTGAVWESLWASSTFDIPLTR